MTAVIEYESLARSNAALMDELDKAYTSLRAQLPRSDVQGLFFKEEEVRWSWEMARRAGEIPP